ncbi:MAG: hypothetical protein EZS28_045091 [Streblomastix strix]|uniref:Uncharacterized protein n=1 Tax=Streblomastix strix TaxID=222440 RepID=A0A5J4TNC1_9EUKA|nr:MAG: hypothetical protein EZS28_045091 [Streblomastix strix]
MLTIACDVAAAQVRALSLSSFSFFNLMGLGFTDGQAEIDLQTSLRSQSSIASPKSKSNGLKSHLDTLVSRSCALVNLVGDTDECSASVDRSDDESVRELLSMSESFRFLFRLRVSLFELCK